MVVSIGEFDKEVKSLLEFNNIPHEEIKMKFQDGKFRINSEDLDKIKQKNV